MLKVVLEEKGLQGYVGADGGADQQGPSGSRGEQGAQGKRGRKGTIGLDGTATNQGAQGADGPQGTAGAKGPRGRAGTAGTSHQEIKALKVIKGIQGPLGLVRSSGFRFTWVDTGNSTSQTGQPTTSGTVIRYPRTNGQQPTIYWMDNNWMFNDTDADGLDFGAFVDFLSLEKMIYIIWY